MECQRCMNNSFQEIAKTETSQPRDAYNDDGYACQQFIKCTNCGNILYRFKKSTDNSNSLNSNDFTEYIGYLTEIEIINKAPLSIGNIILYEYIKILALWDEAERTGNNTAQLEWNLLKSIGIKREWFDNYYAVSPPNGNLLRYHIESNIQSIKSNNQWQKKLKKRL